MRNPELYEPVEIGNKYQPANAAKRKARRSARSTLILADERRSEMEASADVDPATPNEAVALETSYAGVESVSGPDVLDPETSIEQVIDRFQDRRFCRRSFLVLLLDQGFLCGLGNYLRSEILFVARLHPTRRPIDCTAEQIARLSQAAIALPWQSYETGGITNDVQLAAALKQQGYHRNSYRHWVFNREGQPCFVCQTPIVKEFAGGRRYYYCPLCQPLA